MFKYTRHKLKKLETLFEEMEYSIRYEKGSFNSGYCIVEDRKVAVINKFYDTEARINCLLDILGEVSYSEISFTPASEKVLKEVEKLISKRQEEEE